MGDVAALTQRSTVGLEEREVVVTSRVFLEPEPLILTEVTHDGTLITKTHVSIPRSDTSADPRASATALASTLQAHHLRFVHGLIGGRSRQSSRPPPRPYVAGTLARLRLGPNGEAIERDGEDQVPGTWLRTAYLAIGAFDDLGFGAVDRATLRCPTLSTILSRDGEATRVTFFEPAATPPLDTMNPVDLQAVVLDDLVRGVARFTASSATAVGCVSADAAWRITERARLVVGGAEPVITTMYLQYESSHVMLTWAPDQTLLVIGSTALSSSDVASRLGEATGRSGGASLAPEILRSTVVAALTDLVKAARTSLGFPVIRNYVKHAQKEVGDRFPWVTAITVGIDGKISLEAPDPDVDVDGYVNGLQALYEPFAKRAHTVAPDLVLPNLATIVGALEPTPASRALLAALE